MDQSMYYDTSLILAKTKEMWEVVRLNAVKELTSRHSPEEAYVTPDSIKDLENGTFLLPLFSFLLLFPFINTSPQQKERVKKPNPLSVLSCLLIPLGTSKSSMGPGT